MATVTLMESWIREFGAVEMGGIVQNLGLAAAAMGLGGFPHFAAYPGAWPAALGFRMLDVPFSRTIGAGPPSEPDPLMVPTRARCHLRSGGGHPSRRRRQRGRAAGAGGRGRAGLLVKRFGRHERDPLLLNIAVHAAYEGIPRAGGRRAGTSGCSRVRTWTSSG